MAKKKPKSNGNEKPKKGAPKAPAKEQSHASPQPPDFLIVGLGASAGGLEAFKQFFKKMLPDTGMAFVVVQHLDPTHKSMLSELLQNYTKMKVLEVKDSIKVAPNTIYTIPPNKGMGILNGTLHLMVPEEARGFRRTIDYFLRSLAEDQKEKAVGIILSGTGTEGAIGLKAIKGEGGLAVVQDPSSAKYDGMPRNAIASNAADFILPAEEIPEYLIKYMKKRKIKPIALQVDIVPQQNLMDKIFLLLRDRTGNNFSYYKMSTINRRIDKRMAINQIPKLDTYLKYLQNTPEEIELLFKDLLIGVSAFFRDKKAFEALQSQVLPRIINSKTINDTIRIWVPGCSTGEEAFTIAILFDEALDKQKKKIAIQVFASDLDKEAIDYARLGVYPDSIAVDIGKERLQRYFTIENQQCKVKKELRDKVIFAVQNLVSDPPFSKVDMISCRNLLIYLNTEAQKRVFRIFHYSLNPEGILFLGTSETIGYFSNLFSTLDRKNKIFIRKSGGVKQTLRLDFGGTDIDPNLSAKTKSGLLQKPPAIKLSVLTEKLLLLNYAPACVIIDEKNNAVYFYGNTGKYLQPKPGEASFNIIDMARLGLKSNLRTAINKVRKSKKEEFRPDVKVQTNGEYQTINLKVKPISQIDAGEQLLMVIFEDITATEPTTPEFQTTSEGEYAHLVELEHELASTREYLRTAIEELEISNEEMKSSNEELQSSNEELQSTNEELETSKEELQSVNEELITVNTELQIKIDELALAHDDMANLLVSTEIGTIFLGSDLGIKRFTPSITKVMNLIPADIGRPINHLSSNLVYGDLSNDALDVLSDLVTKKKVVQSKEGSWYHMQITPYRTTENVIDGVVITFVDITEEKRIEEELKKTNEHLTLALEAMQAVPFTFSMTKRFLFVGKGTKKMLGFLPDNFTSDPGFWIQRIHPNDKKNVLASLDEIKNKIYLNLKFRWKCANGKYKQLLKHIRLIKSPENSNEDYIVGIWQEISNLGKLHSRK